MEVGLIPTSQLKSANQQNFADLKLTGLRRWD